MRNNIKLAYSSLKILLLVSVLVTTIHSLGISWLSLTTAWFTSQVSAVSNIIETGYWTPATPVQLGWNLPILSLNPNDVPVDLACGSVTNGGDPAAPRVAFVWEAVTGFNIMYQREYTYPDGTTKGYAYSALSYTPFSSFGSSEGIDGVWQNRVRAFSDINGNGIYDEGIDTISAWSTPCQLTLDTTSPVTQFNNIPRTEDLSVDKPSTGPEYLNIYGRINDLSSITYQVRLYLKHTAGADDAFDPTIDQEVVAQRSIVKSVANPVGQELLLHNKDVFFNSSFEQGLESWQTLGAVEIVSTYNDTQAQQGDLFAKLDYSQSISQTIDNSGDGVRSVGFWYQVQAQPSANLEESPSVLTVFANGQEMLNLDLSDRAQPSQFADDGWRFASVYLAEIENEQIELQFKVTGEGYDVFIDNVSSNTVVVNPTAVFTIKSQQPEFAPLVAYQYRYQGRLITHQAESGLEFSLQYQPDDGLLEFWSIDASGNVLDRKQIQVWIDYTPPTKITDLEVFEQAENQFELVFSAPQDNFFSSVREYDIRYSSEPITATTDWESLQTVSFMIDGLLVDKGSAPLTSGLTEKLIVTGVELAGQYYFAIKSVDQASNLSVISNVALAQPQPVLEPQVRLISVEPSNLQLLVENAVEFTTAEYELRYEFMYQPEEGQPAFLLTAGVVGSVELNEGMGESEKIYLGTCSEGGTCTPHLGVEPSSIQIMVTLTDELGNRLELLAILEGDLHEQLEIN